MADVRLRPRFRRVVQCSPHEFLQSLREIVERPGSGIRGRVFESSAVLKVSEEQTRFWSPQLQLSIDPDGHGGCCVHGLFGPHPTIWSLFVALYVAAAFIGTMGLLFTSAEWMIGSPLRALWAVPGAAILALVGYAVARTGRRLGRVQTNFLYDEVEKLLDAHASEQRQIHDA